MLPSSMPTQVAFSSMSSSSTGVPSDSSTTLATFAFTAEPVHGFTASTMPSPVAGVSPPSAGASVAPGASVAAGASVPASVVSSSSLPQATSRPVRARLAASSLTLRRCVFMWSGSPLVSASGSRERGWLLAH